MSSSAWGDSDTQYFFELTPERILDAVEASGIRCTGRCLTLNSMENRVYEVEIELDDDVVLTSPSDRFRIVKFYRPGRWSKDQILEEHQFLLDLKEAEIPAVCPMPFSDGTTLKQVTGVGIWYAVFPKVGGRSPFELSTAQLEQIGRLIARIHQVGAVRDAPNRILLTPQSYGIENLKYLVDSNSLPSDISQSYQNTVEALCKLVSPWFEKPKVQRIHGDCHLGNLLWGTQGAFFVDFDDMVQGPCVQDIWLLVPGRDEESQLQINTLLTAYGQMRSFDWESLRLIEPLRALRFIHFSAWIAKRWGDPAFKRIFTQFGTQRYWEEQLLDLKDQLELIKRI